jgi:hypothetical protein
VTFPSTLHHSHRTVPAAGQVSRVVVSNDSGDVVVEAGTSPRVVQDARWNVARPTVTQRPSGGVLTVRARCPRVPLNNCSVDLTIVVPAAVSVQASSGAGNVTTRNLTGDEALSSSAGDVTARNVSAGQFVATSDAGDVVAGLRTAPSLARLDSSAGDLALTVPTGRYRISAHSDSGDVSVRNLVNDPSSARSLVLHSSAGDITATGH